MYRAWICVCFEALLVFRLSHSLLPIKFRKIINSLSTKLSSQPYRQEVVLLKNLNIDQGNRQLKNLYLAKSFENPIENDLQVSKFLILEVEMKGLSVLERQQPLSQSWIDIIQIIQNELRCIEITDNVKVAYKSLINVSESAQEKTILAIFDFEYGMFRNDFQYLLLNNNNDFSLMPKIQYFKKVDKVINKLLKIIYTVQ
jgi:hypothetical protein